MLVCAAAVASPPSSLPPDLLIRFTHFYYYFDTPASGSPHPPTQTVRSPVSHSGLSLSLGAHEFFTCLSHVIWKLQKVEKPGWCKFGTATDTWWGRGYLCPKWHFPVTILASTLWSSTFNGLHTLCRLTDADPYWTLSFFYRCCFFSKLQNAT